MSELWQKMIEFFTEKGVSTGLATAYIIVSALLVVMALVALVMWIIVCIKYFAANKTRTTSGKTGLELAREMLDKAGLKHIKVQRAGLLRAIFIGNCYSITKKTVFLRGAIANKNSVTSVAMALQKVGIAQLCEKGDKKAIARNSLQVVSIFGPMLFIPIVLIGAVIDFCLFKVFGTFSMIAIAIGLFIMVAGFLVTLLNIPVEKRANKMALETIKSTGVLNEEEQKLVKKVFDAYIIAYIMDFIVTVLRVVQLVLEIVMNSQISKNS